jgi:hypothetical protein
MSSGPTQNYDDATLGRWKPHPVIAACVRVVLVGAPPLVAIVFGLAAVRWVSADRLGMNRWVWLAAEIAMATLLLLVAARLTRRLLPMSSLLRLTLYFPDQAPSRFAVAMRRYSPEALRERVEAASGRGEPLDEEHHHAALLLDLVAAISEHDRTTRGHSERVQAYAALMGTELGLSEGEAAKLSWAALLHDVGKLHVPPEILNRSSLPTDEEWEVLSTHPSAGMTIAEPLAAWLGPWIDVVGQHHERWDGAGYPHGLAGHAISRGARIVAVADAYDAITSARSYKKAMSPSAARAELARCSGQQFDPEAVRAFLAVGLGRLRRIAGPLSMLSLLPGLRSMPLPDLGSLATVASAAVAVAVAGVVGALPTVAGSASAGDDVVPTTSLATGAATNPVPSTSASPTASPATSPTALPTALPTAQPPAVAAPSPASAPLPPATQPPAVAPLPPATQPPAVAPPVPVASPCARAAAGATAMAGADLSGCKLEGITLTGDYSGAILVGADLTGATLTGLNLTGAKLNGANLDGATISATSFDGALLTGTSFTGATLSGSSFVGVTVNANTFRGAQVSNCTFD